MERGEKCSVEGYMGHVTGGHGCYSNIYIFFFVSVARRRWSPEQEVKVGWKFFFSRALRLVS